MADRDLYAEARGLAGRLRAQGDRAPADEIDDAIDGGSTSSEILFDMRGVLDRLLRERPTSWDLRDDTEELREAIEELLA